MYSKLGKGTAVATTGIRWAATHVEPITEEAGVPRRTGSGTSPAHVAPVDLWLSRGFLDARPHNNQSDKNEGNCHLHDFVDDLMICLKRN